jgi:hypothetical protein
MRARVYSMWTDPRSWSTSWSIFMRSGVGVGGSGVGGWGLGVGVGGAGGLWGVRGAGGWGRPARLLGRARAAQTLPPWELRTEQGALRNEGPKCGPGARKRGVEVSVVSRGWLGRPACGPACSPGLLRRRLKHRSDSRCVCSPWWQQLGPRLLGAWGCAQGPACTCPRTARMSSWHAAPSA